MQDVSNLSVKDLLKLTDKINLELSNKQKALQKNNTHTDSKDFINTDMTKLELLLEKSTHTNEKILKKFNKIENKIIDANKKYNKEQLYTIKNCTIIIKINNIKAYVDNIKNLVYSYCKDAKFKVQVSKMHIVLDSYEMLHLLKFNFNFNKELECILKFS